MNALGLLVRDLDGVVSEAIDLLEEHSSAVEGVALNLRIER